MTWGPTDSAWRPPEPQLDPGGGEEVEGYTDLVEVGRGGDSIVYRARDLSLRRDVAIKVLLVDDEDRALRFAREVEITLDLGRQHPNIITVLAVATTRSGRPAIVMDFHEGGTLQDRLRSHGPMPVEEVVRIGEVVADALAFAHGRGVLHRDVKPQNVLVLPTSWVLADFGIARLADSEHTSSAETFTYRHAAPQVLDGYPPTAADDLWSLGSTLFTLLDGRPPFASDDPHDDSALAYLRRARTEPHRRLTAPGTQRLAAVIDRCLQKRVADRWPDAAQLRDALAGLRAAAWEPDRPAGPPAGSGPPDAPLPQSPGGLLDAPHRPGSPGSPGAGEPDDGAWRPAPVPDDRTAPRHSLPRGPVGPVPGEVPAGAHAAPPRPPVDPAPVALSVAGRTPEPADAEATGHGGHTGPLDPHGGPAAPAPVAAAPPGRSRLLLLLGLVVLALVVGLGVGGVLLRDDDPAATTTTTPTEGAELVPTLSAEPTGAAPVRGGPDPDLAFVFTTLEARPDGLVVSWRPLDEPDVDSYALSQVSPERKPLAELPATSREEEVPVAVPGGRSCYYLTALLTDGRYGLSNRRCITR